MPPVTGLMQAPPDAFKSKESLTLCQRFFFNSIFGGNFGGRFKGHDFGHEFRKTAQHGLYSAIFQISFLFFAFPEFEANLEAGLASIYT